MTIIEIALSVNSLILGFLLIDYLKFRFNPPYPLKADCLAKHLEVNGTLKQINDKLDKVIDKLFEVVGGK